MITEKKWRGLKSYMSKAFSAIKGVPIKVMDVEATAPNAPGYTSKTGNIHLAKENDLYDGLDDGHHEMGILGVGTHELMHQMMTNFALLERVDYSYPKYERTIFHQLHNAMEDARIEHYAYQFVGGNLLTSLKFIIAHTYKIAPRIDEPLKDQDDKVVLDESGNPVYPQPFMQYMNAMIQFGDMGVIKGHFLDDQAKEIFLKTAPLFDRFIYETSDRKSIKLAKEVFELSRPLWQDIADKNKFLEELAKAMEKAGKTPSSGSGSPSGSASDDSGEEGDSKSSRRKVSMKEYADAMKNSGSGSSGSGSGSSIDCNPENAEEAREAAETAKECAKEAEESAKNAEAKAKADSTDTKAARDAKRARSNAEKAKEAANESDAAAKEAEDAKSKGDESAEKDAAHRAGVAAKMAANAAKRASDAEQGKSSSSSDSKTAEDAQESANDAESAASDAENAAKEAEKNAKSDGSSESAKNAEKAKKNAEKAKEAAEKAKEHAEAAKAAKEAGDSKTEAKEARAAEREAKKAEKAANAAENASEGKDANGNPSKSDSGNRGKHEKTDPNEEGSAFDSEVTDRATDGADPDYNMGSADPDQITDDDFSTEFENEDYELSDEDLEAIESEIERCLEEEEIADKLDSDADEPLPDIDVTSPRFRKAHTCLNRKITVDDSSSATELYARIIAKLNPGISSLTSQLRRIFKADQEEKEYRSSGKINVKRLNSGRMTARVFDKRRSPAQKSNLSVLLLIDESGSMYGSRAEAAKQCAIALSETLKNCNVPCYVIGFTADTSGYDAVHNHYIGWRSNAKDRLKLLDITARANNFDGYSIRYAGEVLKRHNAEHKLMIVISDGQPACYAYSGVDGIADTKDAIRDVRKYASVLGVAIGNDSTETLHHMYGRDFIHISDVNELFSGISKKIAKLIREWD